MTQGTPYTKADEDTIRAEVAGSKPGFREELILLINRMQLSDPRDVALGSLMLACLTSFETAVRAAVRESSRA